jgi:hypothetical protein
MYIGRPNHFTYEKAKSANRLRFPVASIMFVLLAIVGPIASAWILAIPPGGEIPAFIGL